MKKVSAAAVALVLASTLVVLPASAQAATKTTTIVLDIAEPVSNGPFKRGDMGGTRDYLLAGHLRTASKCLAGRRMKAVAVRGGNSRALDTDRTSSTGAWAFRATLDPSRDDVRVTVRRSKAGRDTCGADRITLGGA